MPLSDAASKELTLAEVEHVARLARLDLTAEETELFREQVGSILGYVALLGQLDTEAIPPSASVLPLTNVMGDDEPRPGLDRARALANAPATEDGQFRVPAIFEDQ